MASIEWKWCLYLSSFLKNPLFFDFQSKKEIFKNVLIQELDEFYLFADTRFLFVVVIISMYFA